MSKRKNAGPLSIRHTKKRLKKYVKRGQTDAGLPVGPRYAAWAAQHVKELRKKGKRSNPQWKAGKWIKASAVRVRKVAGRVVMDIKKAI